MIEADVVELLLADATVVAAVGGRITPVAVRVEAGLPALTFARQAGARTYTFTGAPDATITIALTAWASEWPAARNLAEAVREALDMATSEAIEIASVTDGADVYDPDAGLFGCTIIAEVQYSEE